MSGFAARIFFRSCRSLVSDFARQRRHAFRFRARWQAASEQVCWRSPARGFGSNQVPQTRHGLFFTMTPSRESWLHAYGHRVAVEEGVFNERWLDLGERGVVGFR